MDSNADWDLERLGADRKQVVARAKREGVNTILSLAMIDETDSYQRAFPLVAEFAKEQRKAKKLDEADMARAANGRGR